ncbi:MAG: VanZ family protein, partial [Candidatus Latescibacterota bacterium]
GVWNSLALYSPFRFRVWRADRPEEKSAWVTFYLGPSAEGGAGQSPDGVLLGLAQAGAATLTHARNLVWGLGLGLADLYLLAAAVPAADLSAYALLACIAGAIAWPGVQRLGVARCRAWGLAALYIAFVYSTVPVMPAVWAALREYTSGSVRYLGILAVAAAACLVAVRLWRRVRGSDPWPYLALLAVLPVYAFLLDRYAVFPSERLHLVEYGFMGWVLFGALRIDLPGGRAYAASLVLTVLVGFGDECIQWVLPQRFFELKDVELNAVSGGLGLLVLRFVVRPSPRTADGPSARSTVAEGGV